jgi:hypothetical protein
MVPLDNCLVCCGIVVRANQIDKKTENQTASCFPPLQQHGPPKQVNKATRGSGSRQPAAGRPPVTGRHLALAPLPQHAAPACWLLERASSSWLQKGRIRHTTQALLLVKNQKRREASKKRKESHKGERIKRDSQKEIGSRERARAGEGGGGQRPRAPTPNGAPAAAQQRLPTTTTTTHNPIQQATRDTRQAAQQQRRAQQTSCAITQAKSGDIGSF